MCTKRGRSPYFTGGKRQRLRSAATLYLLFKMAHILQAVEGELGRHTEKLNKKSGGGRKAGDENHVCGNEMQGATVPHTEIFFAKGKGLAQRDRLRAKQT